MLSGNEVVLDQKPRDNPYYVGCAVKSFFLLLLAPFYLVSVSYDLLKKRFLTAI